VYFSGHGTRSVGSRDGSLTPNNLNLSISIGTVAVVTETGTSVNWQNIYGSNINWVNGNGDVVIWSS
jgi:hypothetical protein